MVTRVDARLLYPRMRMVLHGHRFLRVVRCDVLEDFLLGERRAVFREASEPQARSLRVEVVSNAKVVFPDTLNSLVARTLFFLRLFHRLSKHIIVVRIDVAEIHGSIFLSLVFSFNNLHFFVISVAVKVDCSLLLVRGG